MTPLVRALTVVALLPIAADAAEAPVPNALVCDFQGVHYAKGHEGGDWEKGKSGDSFSLTFAAIDPKRHTAQIIGNQGAGSVMLVTGQFELSFIEVTDAGNLTSTSVLIGGAKPFTEQRLPAVHSRHVAMLGPIGTKRNDLLVSQYVGTCQPKY